MAKNIDVVGQRFGRYLVIAKSDKRTKAMKQMVLCKCDCGIEREVVVGNLRSGLSTSCGCWKDEKTSARRKIHGYSKNSMYHRYRAMIRRCYDPLHKEFHNYGGRGIKVCDRWLKSVENYMEDMGEAPFYMASIDRIDNDGDYFKENCHWATKKEQTINRRVTKIIEINGESMCLADWSRKLGCTKTAIYSRLRRGWTIEESINTNKGKKLHSKRWL